MGLCAVQGAGACPSNASSGTVPFSALATATYTDYSVSPAGSGSYSSTLSTNASCYLASSGTCGPAYNSTSPSMDTPLFGWYKFQTDGDGYTIGGTPYAQPSTPVCSTFSYGAGMYCNVTVCATGYGASVDGPALYPYDHCSTDVYSCDAPTCTCGTSSCQAGTNVYSTCPAQGARQVCCDASGNGASGSAGTWTTPACVLDSDCGTGYFCANISTCGAHCAPDDPPSGPPEGGGGGSCGGDGLGDYLSGAQGASCGDDSYCDADDGLYCDPNSDCTCQNDDYEDPVLLDLGGAGYPLTSIGRGVVFDMLANGKPRQLAWSAIGSDIGFLALDRNGNGKIDNGSELFTGVSPQPAPPKVISGAKVSTALQGADQKAAAVLAPRPEGTKNPKRPRKTGFAALAVYDQPSNGGNDDGQIDASDAVYSQLRVWIDKNHDGISQPDELFSLAQLGITSISLSYQPAPWTDTYGNKFSSRTLFVRNGKVQWADDVYLTTAK